MDNSNLILLRINPLIICHFRSGVNPGYVALSLVQTDNYKEEGGTSD